MVAVWQHAQHALQSHMLLACDPRCLSVGARVRYSHADIDAVSTMSGRFLALTGMPRTSGRHKALLLLDIVAAGLYSSSTDHLGPLHAARYSPLPGQAGHINGDMQTENNQGIAAAHHTRT
jgi:hypothetical protein